MTWRERADRLRALPLSRVLRCSGAVPDRADPHKWHTAQGVLSVTGAQFINWNLGCGGGGAIDLVMHLHGLGFGQALEWLERHGAATPTPPVSASPRPPLRLPEPAPEPLAQVRRYLVEYRRLPAALLDPLIASGSLRLPDPTHRKAGREDRVATPSIGAMRRRWLSGRWEAGRCESESDLRRF